MENEKEVSTPMAAMLLILVGSALAYFILPEYMAEMSHMIQTIWLNAKFLSIGAILSSTICLLYSIMWINRAVKLRKQGSKLRLLRQVDDKEINNKTPFWFRLCFFTTSCFSFLAYTRFVEVSNVIKIYPSLDLIITYSGFCVGLSMALVAGSLWKGLGFCKLRSKIKYTLPEYPKVSNGLVLGSIGDQEPEKMGKKSRGQRSQTTPFMVQCLSQVQQDAGRHKDQFYLTFAS